MSQDITYFIRDGNLWKCVENDGYSYLRHGAETVEYYMCTVEEAVTKYPDQLAKATRGHSDAVH